MIEEGLLKYLSKRLYRLLLVGKELYRQQLWMYENRTHSIADRIVSLYQPHVRPMVRGKAKSPVEFGAKVSISLVNGFSFVERIGWDAYNELCDDKAGPDLGSFDHDLVYRDESGEDTDRGSFFFAFCVAVAVSQAATEQSERRQSHTGIPHSSRLNLLIASKKDRKLFQQALR